MTDSDRVYHDLDAEDSGTPLFRSERLDQILRDLHEEESGWGYHKIVRNGNNFITEIQIYSENPDSPENNPNAKLRSKTVFTRTDNFISALTRTIYAEDGTTVVATATANVFRNTNKSVNSVNVTHSRS